MEIRAKEKKKEAPAKPDPASSTPSVQASKGDLGGESSDIFSQMVEAFMGLLSGGTPNPMMGGGTTVMPQGGSPFTQMPTEMDLPQRNPFFESGPDESILASILQGPPQMPANQTQEMTGVPPMMQQAMQYPGAQATQEAAAPPQPVTPPTPRVPTLRPPVPQQNPAFTDDGSLGAMLQQLFTQQRVAPTMPTRNPMFTGGV